MPQRPTSAVDDQHRQPALDHRGDLGGRLRAENPATSDEVLSPPVAPRGKRSWWRRTLLDDGERTSSWLSSLLFHTTVLLLLALIVRPYAPDRPGPQLTSLLSEDAPALEESPSVTGELEAPAPEITTESTVLEVPDAELSLESFEQSQAAPPSEDVPIETADVDATGDASGVDVSFRCQDVTPMPVRHWSVAAGAPPEVKPPSIAASPGWLRINLPPADGISTTT
ncbi:MAG: hypothetical protein R3C10_15885 [Pirellulales bacterium]